MQYLDIINDIIIAHAGMPAAMVLSSGKIRRLLSIRQMPAPLQEQCGGEEQRIEAQQRHQQPVHSSSSSGYRKGHCRDLLHADSGGMLQSQRRWRHSSKSSDTSYKLHTSYLPDALSFPDNLSLVVV